MTESKQINFTIVPDESAESLRAYANFCAVNHTPFDFTITFCEMAPLSEKDIRAAEAEHVVRAPVKARIVMSPQVVPNLMYATGHYRNGVLLAPLTAQLVADAMLEDRVDPALAAVSPARFGDL